MENGIADDHEAGVEGFKALYVNAYESNVTHRLIERLLHKLVLQKESQYGVGYSLEKTMKIKAHEKLPHWANTFLLSDIGGQLTNTIVEYLSDKILDKKRAPKSTSFEEVENQRDNSLYSIVSKLDELVGTETLIRGIVEGGDVIAKEYESKKNGLNTDTELALRFPESDQVRLTSSNDFNRILLITSIFGEVTCGDPRFIEANSEKIVTGIKELENQITANIDEIMGKFLPTQREQLQARLQNFSPVVQKPKTEPIEQVIISADGIEPAGD